MEPSIFKYILRYSKKEQLLLVFMTALSLPFLYYSYDLPKIIVNKAIGGTDFPADFFGLEFGQIPFLLFLCSIFLALVFVNGGFKYAVNVYRGIVGERMLRRLRFMLIERTLRFPLPHFRNVSQGEIVSMVTTETEPLGGFIGDSFSLLAHQGGALVVPLVFIFVQDPLMGLAAIALYPVQAHLIPKLQRRVNMLGKERVQTVRKVSERIGETVSGVQDIHAHYTYQYELADFSGYLGKIFEIRNKIYRLKFFIKFLNNFLAQLTPFFFYSIGGYFVITGELTFGALLAVIAAYKDLAAPWKELLTYYQRMEDARIKYQQLIEQFEVPGMMDEALVAAPDETPPRLSGPVVASNVSLEMEEGSRIVDGASFTFDSGEHVALVGGGGSGKTEIANLLARQIVPTGGKISVGDADLSTLPEAVTGRDIGYVDQDAYIRAGTIEDNLLYSLKHLPANGAGHGANGEDRPHWLREAMASGNSQFDPSADWIDLEAVGTANLSDRIVTSLDRVGLVDGVFHIGLRRVVDPEAYPGLAERVLEARSVVRERLTDPALADLVDVFEQDRFIANASVAENILFGTPVGNDFAIDTLGRNPHVMQILERVGIADEFVQIGRSVAALMVELFQDLPPGHEFFERFSFVASEDLPEFQRMLNLVGTRGLEGIDEADRARLRDLPFKLIVARHHLGLIGKDMEDKLLEARRLFAESLPEELAASIEFFDPAHYSRSSTIQDNILFGKVAGAKADSAELVGDLISEVVDEVGLRELVLEIGLDFDVGIGGKRLNAAQRQQLAVARCLLKQPQLMIVNEAASSLDPTARTALFHGVREEMRGRGLVWVDTEPTGGRVRSCADGRLRQSPRRRGRRSYSWTGARNRGDRGRGGATRRRRRVEPGRGAAGGHRVFRRNGPVTAQADCLHQRAAQLSGRPEYHHSRGRRR